MATYTFTGTMSLVSTNTFSKRLASVASTGQTYDMPLAWSFDINMTSANAVGTLAVYAQNDDPAISTFITAPIYSFPVSGGTFANGNTKQTIDSNGLINTRFVGVKWTFTSGTGSAAIDGLITTTVG